MVSLNIDTPVLNQTVISQLSLFIDLNPYITSILELKFQLLTTLGN